jgi:hypothetical protein
MTKSQYRTNTPDAIAAFLAKGGNIVKCTKAATTPKDQIKLKGYDYQPTKVLNDAIAAA